MPSWTSSLLDRRDNLLFFSIFLNYLALLEPTVDPLCMYKRWRVQHDLALVQLFNSHVSPS